MLRNDEKAPSEATANKLIDTIRTLTMDSLSQGLDQALTLADDMLLAKAEKASSNIERTLYFNTMRDIRRSRSKITRAFHSKISENFHTFGHKPTITLTLEGESDEDATPLLHTDACEDTLQITNLSNTVQTQSYEALFGIEKRLAVINKGRPVKEEDNPLHPKRFAEGFAVSISPCGIHNQIKPDIYNLFEQQVMAQLADIYKAANEQFIQAGILPNLRPSTEIQEQSAPESATPDAKPPQSATTTPKTKSEPLCATLLNHFCKHAPTSKGPVYGHTVLFTALSELQKQALDGSFQPFKDTEGAKEFKQAIIEELERESDTPRTLTAEDDGILTFVGHIFDYIAHDPRTPDEYHGIFSKMSLPWARMTLDEQNPLEYVKHPARLLINEMAEAAEQFQDSKMFSRDLFHQCETIIEALIQEPRLRKYRLRELLDSLEKHIAILQQKANTIEQRNIAAGRGQEALLSARIWAEEMVRNCSRAIPLKKYTSQFLKTVWVDTLIFHYLCYRTTEDRDLCKELTGRLIDVVSKEDCTEEEFIAFADKAIAFLIRQDSLPEPTIRKLVHELSKDAYGDETDLTLLEQFNQQLMNTCDATLGKDTFVPPKLDEIINKLRPGLLCKAMNDNGEPRRWKLAWQTQKGSLFLFVDGSGQKTAMVDRSTLASWIKQKKLRFQTKEQASVLSRALAEIEKKILSEEHRNE
ncbi:DUF1631 family protein [Sansalvadorimonas verongulae]|uniref:DUF1631 family protein n=1 Tax=Sansalvadorimonas verongulae TaxID=2172824 RepID=UPI0012BC40C8|nr:DUF1631 family protein [Sansalvadorimonas verongulae]MTI15221.1 DUF1631 family protein [Sansalvadorimonas verongulae]